MTTLPDIQALPQLENLRSLLIAGVPLIDLRAPVEFAQGALPTALNLPLMNDAERAAVGTCYKKSGQEAAIALGLKLVSGTVKQQRIKAWAEYVAQHPEVVLYCFRGGLRSKISQYWLYEHTGKVYPSVKGGYKALRRLLLDELDSFATKFQVVVISGRTGSGKTRFLQQFPQTLDLEALANHRGSAFGPKVTPQPSQINFENTLVLQLMQHEAAGRHTLFLEDESRNIGSIHVPEAILAQLKVAPLVLLETDDETRVQISYQEYVLDMMAAFRAHHNDEAMALQAFSAYLLGSLQKIHKRLGGVRYANIKAMMQAALDEQTLTGHTEAHLEWVKVVLLDYYDPMYDYQLACKEERVVFRGDATAVREYLSLCDTNV